MTRLIYFAVIAGLFYAFLVGMLNLLPNAGPLPSGFADAITLIYGYMLLFNFFFPIDSLFTILALVIAWEVALITWYGIRWVLAIITNWLSV